MAAKHPQESIAGSEQGRGIFTAMLGFFTLPKTLDTLGRRTFRYHFTFKTVEGAFAGLFALFAYYAGKELEAGLWEMALITSVPLSMFALSMYYMRLMEGKDFSKAVRVVTVIMRGSLLTTFLFANPTSFIAISFLMSAGGAFIVLCENVIVKSNYPPGVRGRLVGFGNTANIILFILAVKLGGYLLDANAEWHRWVFPAAGLIGIAGHVVFSLIKPRREATVSTMVFERDRGFFRFITYPARGLFRVFRLDRHYLVYEIGFFIYGMGFMMSMPVHEKFMIDEIGMGYAQRANAALASLVTIAILTMIAGRLIDRIGVIRFTVIPFVIFGLSSLTMSLAQTPFHVYIAFVVFGAAMSCLHFAWSLGPITFAPPGRIEAYTATHTTLVGIRAVPGALLGVWTAQAFSYRTAFIVAMCLFFTGALIILGLSFFRPKAPVKVPVD